MPLSNLNPAPPGDSQSHNQLKSGTAFSQLWPTKLDKIKNLHVEVQARAEIGVPPSTLTTQPRNAPALTETNSPSSGVIPPSRRRSRPSSPRRFAQTPR